jgi:predicted HTH transcriptional regulator
MNLNKDIIDFKELRKKVDRIQYEREMTSIAIFLFLKKISKFFGISQSQFKQ